MQIILVQAEIETAIRNYVNSKVKIQEGQDIRIDLSASRGPEGFRANIDIVDVDAAPAAAPTPATTPKAASPKAGAESSDELVAAKAAKAEAEKKAAAEAKAKADKLAADQAAAEAAEAQREAAAETEAAAKGNDSAGDDKSPPFDPDNKPAEQTATDAAPAAGAPEQPPVRKPLFGKSSAALNA